MIDEDGYLHVRGRQQDLREVCGQAVLPLDVSNALCSHPHVRYAVSVPAPAGAGGFGSIVTLAPETETDEADLRAFVSHHHGPHAVPEIIVFDSSIPTTEQGKPDRNAITALVFGDDSSPAEHEVTAGEGGI